MLWQIPLFKPAGFLNWHNYMFGLKMVCLYCRKGQVNIGKLLLFCFPRIEASFQPCEHLRYLPRILVYTSLLPSLAVKDCMPLLQERKVRVSIPVTLAMTGCNFTLKRISRTLQVHLCFCVFSKV